MHVDASLPVVTLYVGLAPFEFALLGFLSILIAAHSLAKFMIASLSTKQLPV